MAATALAVAWAFPATGGGNSSPWVGMAHAVSAFLVALAAQKQREAIFSLQPMRIAEPQLRRIRDAGIERLSFAWAGSFQPELPHYYRVHGPTLLIEYDNTQNEANHIHTVWHDLRNDFGMDLLHSHYDTEHHRR